MLSTEPALSTVAVKPKIMAFKSKKINNDQIPHPTLKTKRETTKYINWQQFTKGNRGKPNEQPFPRQVVIQLPKIYEIMLLT